MLHFFIIWFIMSNHILAYQLNSLIVFWAFGGWLAECPCSETFFSVGIFYESQFYERGNFDRLKGTCLAKIWASFDRAGQLDIFILGHLLRRWAHFENVGSYFSFQCHERESLSDGAAFEIRLGSGERVFPEIGVGRGQRLRPARQERRRFGAEARQRRA